MAKVLVWDRNKSRPPKIHFGPYCPTLKHSQVPDETVAFAGRGTAGYLEGREAFALPGVTVCQSPGCQ